MTYGTTKTAGMGDLITAVGEPYGFRIRDYSLTWDRKQFDSRASRHALEIVPNDERRVVAEIGGAGLSDDDTWKYLPQVNAAFETLGRPASARGI